MREVGIQRTISTYTLCVTYKFHFMNQYIKEIKDGFSGERAYVLPPSCVRALESHPLSRILHITDIGYYPNARNHFRQREQPINQYVFIYCVDGSGWFSVNGSRHEVKSNYYFILPSGKPHSYGSDPHNPWTIYWIHFNGELASHYLPGTAKPVEIKPGLKSRIADRLDIFEEIMACMENGFDTENLLYACSIFHHFLGSLRFMTRFRSSKFGHDTKAETVADIVEAAIHYMNENINKKLSTGSIAAYTGYSSSQFSLLFAKRTGMSPIAYFNQLKVNLAKRLLVESNLKINQICHKVGIADQYYFSRLFTKTTGLSPSQYRITNKHPHSDHIS